jgi:benzoylformate decarboxylase
LSKRAAAAQEVGNLMLGPPSDRRIDPGAMMLALSEALPEDALIVEEAPTTAAQLHTFLRVRHPLQAFGLSSGGLGFALPGAIGMALGNPGRRVVALLGDGSAMYAIQGLWTAAHLNLPVSFVIANNRSYRIIKERLIALRDSDHFIGMDLSNPFLDFPDLATGMGVASRSVARHDQLAEALQWAFAGEGPNLLDVQISSGYEPAQGVVQ